MVGFIGVIGVFGLDSVRSTIREMNNDLSDLQKYHAERTRAEGVGATQRYPTLVERIEQLQREIEDAKAKQPSRVNLLFLTVVVFLALVVFAIMGLGKVWDSLDWRVPLFMAFLALFEGSYAIYRFVVTITRITGT